MQHEPRLPRLLAAVLLYQLIAVVVVLFLLLQLLCHLLCCTGDTNCKLLQRACTPIGLAQRLLFTYWIIICPVHSCFEGSAERYGHFLQADQPLFWRRGGSWCGHRNHTYYHLHVSVLKDTCNATAEEDSHKWQI